MEVYVVDFEDPVWQEYFQGKTGRGQLCCAQTGKILNSRRTSDPALNQELELEYLQKRSVRFDLEVFLKSIRALARSKWNIKARASLTPKSKIKLAKVCLEFRLTHLYRGGILAPNVYP